MTDTVRTLKVGVAGLGVGSTQIIPALEKMPGMKLVAAADLRNDALETFKQKYGGRIYDSVEKLCADPEVEAVWISTPNQFHCEHVITAAERGKHAVVEKPMALTIEECERMVAAVEKHKVKLLCGHTQSFNPAIRAMRKAIAAGELGGLRALHTWMYTDWMLRPRPSLRTVRSITTGGGAWRPWKSVWRSCSRRAKDGKFCLRIRARRRIERCVRRVSDRCRISWMLNKGFLLTTKRTKDTKNGQSDWKSHRISNMIFFSFVIFVSFVVVYSVSNAEIRKEQCL